MKIASLSNVIKSNPTEAARAFLNVISNECEIRIANELSGIIPQKEAFSDEELFAWADIAVVFGGDGTTLTAARRAAPYNIPVLSINTGHLGFLAAVSAQDAAKAAECLLKNNLSMSERLMLNVKVIREEKEVFSAYALNDVVLARTSGKLCSLSVAYNGSPVSEYRSDGIVIATPTGSTAYSLSCGGPLVLPMLDLFVVTPISPHLLGARPMILPSHGNVEVSFSTDNRAVNLSADGQGDFPVHANDRVIISSAPYKAKLLTLKEQNFFNLIRQKLTLS